MRQGEFAPPRSIDRTIPVGLDAICLKAMATKPEDRYGSPREFADDVERWIADEPVAARREGMWERVSRGVRRHSAMVRSAAAVLVVALGAAALIAVQQSQAADRERTIAGRERRLGRRRRSRGARSRRRWGWREAGCLSSNV